MDKIEIPFKDFIDEKSGEVVKTTGVEEGEILYSINHDSRAIQTGQWFICLRGEAGDGHEFIINAAEKGACGIIYESGNDVSFLDSKIKTVEVKDTTRFLGILANRWRNIVNPVIIAITGSNGKTSTKEMVAFLLDHAFPQKVFHSRGNWNNHFGLPFSLLNMRKTDEYAVVELGTNHPGEIAYLSKIARPDYSIVTSVASGHIGNFGSVEKIAEEKSSIVDGMFGGFLSLPEKIPGREIFEAKAKKQNIEVIFGNKQLSKIASDGEYSHFQYQNLEYVLPLSGVHQFENFKLAVSILEKVGLTPEMLKSAFSDLNRLTNVPGRLTRREHSEYQVWDDSYNANPASFKAAIDFVHEIAKTGAKVGAFGMMGELGEFTISAHKELGKVAALCEFSLILFYSTETAVCEAFKDGYFSVSKVGDICFATNAEQFEKCSLLLKEKMKPGDHLLVKGSRAAKMERIFNFI